MKIFLEEKIHIFNLIAETTDGARERDGGVTVGW